MTLRFDINGSDFWIDEFSGGFGWLARLDGSRFVTESENVFPTAIEAQQDAIEYMKAKRIVDDAWREHYQDEDWRSTRKEVAAELCVVNERARRLPPLNPQTHADRGEAV